MKNILFIHQSSELYGSDKTLLYLLKNIDKSVFYPIVILPNQGPLKDELEKLNIKVVITPVLKLYRNIFTPKNLYSFFKEIKTSIFIVNELNKKYHFQLIYSNTLAVLLGIIFAWKKNIKHVWHVHEIIEKPKIIKKIFTYILSLKHNSFTIFNSNSTAKYWLQNGEIKLQHKVVWNGIEINKNILAEKSRILLKEKLFNTKSDIIIALVGRISSWKGQQLLLKAFKEINNKNTKLVFIGSPPPNQNEFLKVLEDNIISYGLTDKVQILPFQENINKIWQLIDIAVVPSTEPEPFGLVAIEAMFASKPIIASNHGGLAEIVINNKTGILFKPNDINNLKNSLESLICSEEKRIEYGKNGYERAKKLFSVERYSNNIQKVLQNI